MIDPFAIEDAPAPRTSAPAAKSPSAEGKVTLTFKGGTGFDAPWIVIHAADLADARGQVGPELAALMTEVQKAGTHFVGLSPKSGSPAAQRTSNAPQAAQQPPPGSPACPDGWTFKSGVSKAGKAWKGFLPPRGSDDKPIFFD